MKNLKILDCTLRDGGYYNNWDFSEEVVNKYLESIAATGIDYVELGFRNFPKPGFLGPYAYTTERFLQSLVLPDGPQYGVMVDAKSILESGFNAREAVDCLFVPCDESKINLVRVAAHFNEVIHCGEILSKLKELGYIVGLNIMQSGGKPSDAYAEVVRYLAELNALDVLYFADSLGNMDSGEVDRLADVISNHWSGDIGFHSHNNMGKAIGNCFRAIDRNVSWIDATVTGMGRGAGNAQTEILLATLNEHNMPYKPEKIFELAIGVFEPMQQKYGWGSNLLYFLGAKYNIHPTYIQNLLSNPHYGQDEVVGAVNYLKNVENSSSFNGNTLEAALILKGVDGSPEGSSELKNRFEGRDIILLGSGPSVERYSKGIIDFIERRDSVVISVNLSSFINDRYIDYYCITKNSKFLSERERYQQVIKPVIMPRSRFTDAELSRYLPDKKLIDYGLVVDPGNLKLDDKVCTIPYDSTAAYALCVSIYSGCRSISLIGFDGYEKGDVRQQEMVSLLSQITEEYHHVNIKAYTPSTYPVDGASVYEPD